MARRNPGMALPDPRAPATTSLRRRYPKLRLNIRMRLQDLLAGAGFRRYGCSFE